MRKDFTPASCIICRDANGLEESGSDAADELDEEDAVEDSDDEIEVVQEPASTGEGFRHTRSCIMHMCFQPDVHAVQC